MTGMDVTRMFEVLRDEMKAELVDRILPYWMEKAVDGQFGGFLGEIDGSNNAVAGAGKGAVLHARILWTFSAAYRALGNPEYLAAANRAAEYLLLNFLDHEFGGVYWMIDPSGQPVDDRKHVYAQSFAIYGLSEHYRATGDESSLTAAVALFELLELHAADLDRGGYEEALARDWSALDNVRLSEVDANERRSMNTHLHILEAYTTLVRAHPYEAVRRKLVHLVEIMLDRIIDPDTGHLITFLTEHWEPRSKTISYGHDIEASWLLLEAAETTGDLPLIERCRLLSVAIARNVLDDGINELGGIREEFVPGQESDTDMEWWPQAEGIVGFVNAFQNSDDHRFLDAALRLWTFIKHSFLDVAGGEWFRRVDGQGRPYLDREKVGPWKCPYHNGRACLEIMARSATFVPVPIVQSAAVAPSASAPRR
jgi:cellobiose epimerase